MANGIGAGRALAIVGFAAAIGVIAFVLLRPEPVPAPLTQEADSAAGPADEPNTAPAGDSVDAEVVGAPVQTPAVPESSIIAAPQLDVIRIDAAGAAVVAGRGVLGADVIMRVDGEEVAATTADEAGSFVSLFDVGVAEVPRVLTVESRDASGNVTRAPDSIIVAPTFPRAPATPTAPTIAPPSVPIESAGSGTTQRADYSGGVLEANEGTPEVPAVASNDSEPQDAPVVGIDAPDIGEVARAVIAPDTPDAVVRQAPEAQAPRLFRTGPEGVSVVASSAGPPRVREDLGIDAISYDDAGVVSLAGTGARDSELRIYLDNRPVQLARVGQGGTWSSPLPNVESGVYTLRIDAVAEDGSVQSRIETPFQRTAPEVAAASRRDGITAITVQPGYTLWAISEGYFGDGIQYVQIFESNRDQIRDPDLIFPGQVFNLPDTE